MQEHIVDDDGNKLEGDASSNYIQKLTAESFQSNDEVILQQKKSAKENEMEKELVLTNFNWKKTEEKIPKRTSVRLDEVPDRLINERIPKSKEALLKAVGNTLKDSRIPHSWRQIRMNLIYKGTVEKDEIRSYRQLTITSVIYRLAVQAIKLKLQAWRENNGILGELQNA